MDTIAIGSSLRARTALLRATRRGCEPDSARSCKSRAIALDDHASPREDTIGDGGRRFLQEHEVDRRARRSFQPRYQVAQLPHGQRGAAREADREVEIPRTRVALGRGAEHERVCDARVRLQHTAGGLDHGDTLARGTEEPR